MKQQNTEIENAKAKLLGFGNSLLSLSELGKRISNEDAKRKRQQDKDSRDCKSQQAGYIDVAPTLKK